MSNIICIKCKKRFVEVVERVAYDYIDNDLQTRTAHLSGVEFLRCPECKKSIYPDGLKEAIAKHLQQEAS